MKAFNVLLAGAMLFAVSESVSAQEKDKSWVGEKVLPRFVADKIPFYPKIDGTAEFLLEYNGRVAVVREEIKENIRFHDGHTLGWAKKSEFVRLNDAEAYFDERIKADPKDIFAWHSRGTARLENGAFDNAIKDFDECITLAPGDPAAFVGRGQCWYAKKEFDKAIQDFDDALRIDSEDPLPFNNRGCVRCTKKEYDKAIEDFDAAIKLDPTDANAFGNRAAALMLLRKAGAPDGFQKVIDLQGWLGSYSTDAVILGHLAARIDKDQPRAKKFLDDSDGKLDGNWPYPIVSYLAGDINEKALLKLADTADKRMEARCCLGLDYSIKGNTEEAKNHFRAVKDGGITTLMVYTIAVAELERLEKVKK